jgi:prepilin-type processing-associated H-X9-DG protein
MRKLVPALIVLLILLFCGGMFTLFVGKAHEAGARVNCFNHCRSIGLGLTNYQETNVLESPPAAIPNLDLPVEKRLSWIVLLVPYVEANNIYSRMDKNKSWDAEENRFAAEMRLTYLRCPGYPGQPPGGPLAPTHYVGISGVGDNAIALPREDPHAGVFGYDRSVKRLEFKRGASETVMVVETSRAIGAWTAAGPPTTRGLEPNGTPYFGLDGQFGGNHAHGANVVFADGSVRFIEQTIDPAVWERMATLSGHGNREK